MRGPLLVLSGRANHPLSSEIGALLGISPDGATITEFADGEIFVRIDQNVRGRDVFIVQPTSAPADNIMELCLLIDAAKRASAARVTAVVPYFGYGRQDRKDQPRVAIGAKLAANLLVAAGADHVISIDFHKHQIQGFFDIPVDHMYAAPVLVKYFRSLGLTDLVVISPDVGAAKMARGYAKRLGAAFAIIDKRRPQANMSEVMNVVGEVEGKTCLLVDDMVDTGGSLCNAIRALKDRGAKVVYAAATHALLSDGASLRLQDAPVKEVIVTNTIHIPEDKKFEKLKVLSVAGLLAKVIGYVHSNESVSQLFETPADD